MKTALFLPRPLLVIVVVAGGLWPWPSVAEEAKPAARYVRIGHYQCECRQGDFEANLATVRKGLAQAVDASISTRSPTRNGTAAARSRGAN